MRAPRPWQTALAVWALWAAVMHAHALWGLFAQYWHMSVMMACGSFIAGATSEGGGAVAFPVMTLLFHVPPPTARDFALMIQSVGMTAASLAIVSLGIKVEWRAVRWGALGGALGLALGVGLVSPRLPPAYAKMFFTSLWLSFGAVLWHIDRHKGEAENEEIPGFGRATAVALAGVGVLGGMVSGITGSGLDIVVFSYVVLRHRLCVRVATPTSVVMMALNALTGFFVKGILMGGMAPEAWDYWAVCVPIVVVGAPLGAWYIKERPRSHIKALLYASIVAQFVGALFIVRQTPPLLAFSAATFAGGRLLFLLMARKGT